MKKFAAAILVAAGLTATAGTPSALSATATADLLIDAAPGYVIDVEQTSGYGGADAVDTIDDPICRKQMQDALKNFDPNGYEAKLKPPSETRARYSAFVEISSLVDTAHGTANIEAWRRVISACPEVSLGTLKQELRPVAASVTGVDAQVAYSWSSADRPSPQPVLQFTTAGIMGKVEVIPTGDSRADIGLLTRLAQLQINRINGRQS